MSKIRIKELNREDRSCFYYVLGFIQARRTWKRILELTIQNKDPYLVYFTRCLRRLVYLFDNKEEIVVEYMRNHSGYYVRFRIHKGNLYELIFRETNGLTGSPQSIIGRSSLLRIYLRGAFDSRGRVGYTIRRIMRSDIERVVPRFELRKKRGVFWLKQISSLLREIFAVSANVWSDSKGYLMRINSLKSLEALIKQGLVSGPKREKLENLIQNYNELMEIDYRGRYGEILEKINARKRKRAKFSNQYDEEMDVRRLLDERLKRIRLARLSSLGIQEYDDI
ncbi:hypothetical protein DRZ77_01810 [Candidatus Woesearchaeota archaeon]|nr:hypothetical protein [Candidatus Woesearchaeota archaeon]RLE40578.1 MAG: hypothetical protein DRZ77_01810 [Candidatus Woesearchaeota archaeon]